jgi:predicted amino acid dehydrogenase
LPHSCSGREEFPSVQVNRHSVSSRALAATRGVTPVDRAGKERAIRVIVIGATGNVGTSVLRFLENEEQVESILGLARRHRDSR